MLCIFIVFCIICIFVPRGDRILIFLSFRICPKNDFSDNDAQKRAPFTKALFDDTDTSYFFPFFASGSRCQIFSLYSRIVRSEEKMPDIAVLVTAIFCHFT